MLLIGTGLYIALASPEASLSFQTSISTNVDHMSKDPVIVLFASLLAISAEGSLLSFIVQLAVLVCVMSACERWIGWWKTAIVLVASNIVATLITQLWINYALSSGIYTDSVRYELDCGVSCGMNALLFMLIVRPQKIAGRLAIAVLGLIWVVVFLQPLTFYSDQEDYDGVGHLTSMLIGLLLALAITIHRHMRKKKLASR